jgi:hypothetical protein
MNIEFCCHLCCSSSVIFRHNRPPSLALIFAFRPLFLLADDVFPCFVYAVMTLETAALDTSNKWPFWLQMLQPNSRQQYVHFENMTWLQFCGTSYELLLNTIWIALPPAIYSVNTQKNNERYTQLMFYQCSPHKQFLPYVVFCFHYFVQNLCNYTVVLKIDTHTFLCVHNIATIEIHRRSIIMCRASLLL